MMLIIIMKNFTHFSNHAIKRIEQRSKLCDSVIAKIIDNGLAINIGTKIIFEKRHWLFYSKVDDCFFVAIQDCYTGLIITVLTIEYHENLAWSINDSILKEAKERIYNKQFYISKVQNIKPTTINIKAHYESSEGYRKTKELCKLKTEKYGSDLNKIIKKDSIYRLIKIKCEDKAIDKIIEVTLTLGKKGDSIVVDWMKYCNNIKKPILSITF